MGKKPKSAKQGPVTKGKHKKPFLGDFALDMPINLVWVKVGSDPWWPSRVSSANEVEEVAERNKHEQPRIYKDMKRLLKRRKEDGVFVFFYGEEPFETNLKQYCVHRRVWGSKYEDNPDDPQENSPMSFATLDRQKHCIKCKTVVPIDELKVVGCENCFGWTHIHCCEEKPANGEFFENDEKYFCRKCQKYLNMPEIVRKIDDVKKQKSKKGKVKKEMAILPEEDFQQQKHIERSNKEKRKRKRKRKSDKDNDKEVEDEEENEGEESKESKTSDDEFPNDAIVKAEKNQNEGTESKKRKREKEKSADVAGEKTKEYTISKKKRKGLSKLNDSLSESGSELMILKRKAYDSAGSDLGDLNREIDDDRIICTDFEYLMNRINRYVPGSDVTEGLRKLLKEDMDKWFLNISIIGSCHFDDISDLRKLLEEHVLRQGQWKWDKNIWKKHDMYGELWSVLVKESYKVLRKLMKREDLSARNVKMICNEVLATLLGYIACKNKLVPGVTALERKETDEMIKHIEEFRDQSKKLLKREVIKLFQEHGYSIDKNIWEEDKYHPVYFSIRYQISKDGAFWPEKKPRSLSRKNVFTAFGFYNGVKRVNHEVSKVSLADYQSNLKKEDSLKVRDTSNIRTEEEKEYSKSENESAKIKEEKDLISRNNTKELREEETEKAMHAKINVDEKDAQNDDQGQDNTPNDIKICSPSQERKIDNKTEIIVSKQADDLIQQSESVNKTVCVGPSTNVDVNLKDQNIQGAEVRGNDNVQERNMAKSTEKREGGSESTIAEESPRQNRSEQELKAELEYNNDDIQAAAAADSNLNAGFGFASYDPNEETERVSWFSDSLNTRMNKVLSRTFRHPIPGSSRYIAGAERKAFNYYGGFLNLPEYKSLTTVHVHSFTGGVIPEDSVPVLPDEHGFQQPNLDWWGVEECDLSSGSDSDGEESC